MFSNYKVIALQANLNFLPTLCICDDTFKHLRVNMFYSDDEHSDREPERHRYGSVFLYSDAGYCGGGWHSSVT